jgi:hypothetical protein
VGGDLTVEGTNMDTVSVQTAALDTSIALLHPGAAVQVQLPYGTFLSPASLTVTRQDPSGLSAESGIDAGGGAASVDPIAAYQFAFSIPSLGIPATLSFVAILGNLSVAEQTALVAGVTAGATSLAVKSDLPGSTYQTFALCAGAQTPATDGCVTAVFLDAARVPLPPGSTAIPAAIAFTGVTGSFSTWAVVHTERALAAGMTADVTKPIYLSDRAFLLLGHGGGADLSLVDPDSLRFGVGQVAAETAELIDGNGDLVPDTLVATFPAAGSGVALGDTQACVAGAIDGEAFVACDDVIVVLTRPSCGLGTELALLLPLLGALRARSRHRVA